MLWYFGDPAISWRPVGFPSHPRGWFSIVVHPLFFVTGIIHQQQSKVCGLKYKKVFIVELSVVNEF